MRSIYFLISIFPIFASPMAINSHNFVTDSSPLKNWKSQKNDVIGRSFIKQKLDHFTLANPQLWNQVFLYRKSAMQSKDGAVFLFIGGESAADRRWLLNDRLPFVQLAKRLNASLYLLEHRFYGNSRPTRNLSTANLKFLDAKQAVADIEYFIDEINQREKFTNPKWIAVGGSYSGSLAAWSREKSPRRVRGAIASSAPVLAKLNFYEFEKYAERIIRRVSSKCALQIHNLFKLMKVKAGNAVGRKELFDIFKLDDSFLHTNISDNDVYNFFLLISDYIGYVVMYNEINTRKHRELLTLKILCHRLGLNQTLNSLRDFISFMMIIGGKSANGRLNTNYREYVNFMQDEKWGRRSSQPRAWLYQNCNEFGQFRTSESANGLFAGTLPLKFFVSRCSDIFGMEFTKEIMSKKIKETNEYFGGNKHFNATNVLFSNGSDDPWRALSLTNTVTEQSSSVLIQGTSHVADFYPSQITDSSSLKAVHDEIETKIEKFLS